MFHSNRISNYIQHPTTDKIMGHLMLMWKGDLVTFGWGPQKDSDTEDWHYWMTPEQQKRADELLDRCDATGEKIEDLLDFM